MSVPAASMLRLMGALSVGAAVSAMVVATSCSSTSSTSDPGTGGASSSSSSTSSSTSSSGYVCAKGYPIKPGALCDWPDSCSKGHLELPGCCVIEAVPDGAPCLSGACAGGACKPLPLQFGSICNFNSDCVSNLCLSTNHCSKSCAAAGDCPPAPEWTCAPLAKYPTDMCQCTPSGAEICDGEDNDCNGVVDDGAMCGPTQVCDKGACVCSPINLCNGVCKDLLSDPENCGACAVACAPGKVCDAGACN